MLTEPSVTTDDDTSLTRPIGSERAVSASYPRVVLIGWFAVVIRPFPALAVKERPPDEADLQ